MTDAQYIAWLTSPSSIRCVLVEVMCRVGGSEITRYLSNRGYVTGAAESPANTTYLPILMGGVKYTESLSLTGGTGLAFGDLELLNNSGERDSWLADLWVNRSIVMYIGDPRWPRSDFRMIFNGVVANIDSKRRDRLNIKIRDKLQRLNTPITDVKLGGTTTAKDSLLPLCFGEVHNVTPLLIDPANHVYQVHQSAIESIIEVRDNGVPITVTPTLATGKFALTQSPVGTITASVQGDKPSFYANTVSKTIQRLATAFGQASQRFTLAEIDTANMDAFDAACPQPIGIWSGDRTNVLAMCQDLAASLGAQLSVSRAGKLRLLRLTFPGNGTAFAIGPDDMVAQDIAVSNVSDVVAAVKLGFCRNWTVQQTLSSGILEEHKTLFGQDYLTTTADSPTTAADYRLDVEPVQRNTYLLRRTDADTEANRMLTIQKVPRTTYRFNAFARLLQLDIGQAVTLTHPRFGLSAGVGGTVVSLQPDWVNDRVQVEVMI